MLPVVERSLETNEPVIIVAINYRLTGELLCYVHSIDIKHKATAFGFLASKEVGTAGISNLGLRDRSCF